MKQVFADSSFWIATLHPRDELLPRAAQAAHDLGRVEIVTSDLVIAEVLNHFCALGSNLRVRAAKWAMDIPTRFGFRVVPCSREWGEAALKLYAARPDKEWSYVDCMTFVIMQSMGIQDALSADHHFEQAGFTILLT